MAVDAGDRCRNNREWGAAARNYRKALAIEPSRRPIWVQLGHALKEDDRLDEAMNAYEAASRLPGEDGDAPIHLGMLAKRLGNIPSARAAFAQAVKENPENADGRRELLEILSHPLAMTPAGQERARQAILAEHLRMGHALHHGDRRDMIIYDASDLVSYFRHSRLPTGIQRVQMEVITSALHADPRTQICCFSDDKGQLARLPAALFETIVTLAVASGDLLAPEWTEAMETLSAVIDQGDPIAFAHRAFLVNLGTSWWLQNYFLHIRAAQRQHGIRYVPFVHDFIPVMAPQHCVRELTQDFLSWTFGVFDHARFFIANSQSTKSDLKTVARQLGYQVDDHQIAVVPLDADFRRDDAPLDVEELAPWGITAGGFVLFVSTIESRKNHVMAFQAWLDMIDTHGPDAVPDLVCVGNRGWLNSRVYAMLDTYPALAAKVRMLTRLSDQQLALLYRHCCFTIYPSSYEGWGLPITEALCYGKVPLLTRTSSLPEAGGAFAVYVEPGDHDGFVRQLDQLWFDTAQRQKLEQNIKDHFQPRRWQDIANQIRAELQYFAEMADDVDDVPPVPEVGFNKLYRMERNRLTRLARITAKGDILRHDTGWWQPEDWGCWTKPEGGEILFGLPGGKAEAMVCLSLRTPPGTGPGQVTLSCGNGISFQWVMAPDSRQWVCVPAKLVDGHIRIALRGDAIHDNSAMSHYHDMRKVAVGLEFIAVLDGPVLPDVSSLAARVAHTAVGHFNLLRDVAAIMHLPEPAGTELTDYLQALETQTIMVEDVIASMAAQSQATIIDLRHGDWA